MALLEKIPFTSIETEFEAYISTSFNSRILFSAPFGTGKTTFLIDFFTKYKKYKTVHLYPVNYSVANNDDIFELIKYDIFYELIGKHKDELQLKNEEFSMLLTSQSFLMHEVDIVSIIKAFIKNTSKIGKASVEIVDALKNEVERYVNYHKDQKINEFDKIRQYLETFKSIPGLTELDEFTRLITELLERLKGENEELKTVLVIDDLDRIDPEHIFRLFNVFSAHFDSVKDQNKFGFDQVIFVCDIHNIQRIYEHRYGEGVNFVGYMNKFYSKGVYFFNNKLHVADKLESILNLFTPVNVGNNQNDPVSRYHLGQSQGHFYETILFLSRAFLEADLLDLRSLVQMEKFQIINYKFFDEENRGKYSEAINYDFLVIVQFFAQLFGGINYFEDKMLQLSKLKSSDPKNFEIEKSYYDKGWGSWIIEYCLPFLVKADLSDVRNNSISNTYKYGTLDIHYTIQDHMRKIYYSYNKITNGNDAIEVLIDDFNIFQFIYDTITKTKKENKLRVANYI